MKEIDYKPAVNEAVEDTKRYLKMCGDSFYFQLHEMLVSYVNIIMKVS